MQCQLGGHKQDHGAHEPRYNAVGDLAALCTLVSCQGDLTPSRRNRKSCAASQGPSCCCIRPLHPLLNPGGVSQVHGKPATATLPLLPPPHDMQGVTGRGSTTCACMFVCMTEQNPICSMLNGWVAVFFLSFKWQPRLPVAAPLHHADLGHRGLVGTGARGSQSGYGHSRPLLERHRHL